MKNIGGEEGIPAHSQSGMKNNADKRIVKTKHILLTSYADLLHGTVHLLCQLLK
jgi:hypothetical protein